MTILDFELLDHKLRKLGYEPMQISQIFDAVEESIEEPEDQRKSS